VAGATTKPLRSAIARAIPRRPFARNGFLNGFTGGYQVRSRG